MSRDAPENDVDMPPDISGGYGGRVDTLSEARDVVLTIMRGNGGRNAMTRLLAAKMVLGKEWLEHLSDEDLLAEVRRRAGDKGNAS